MEGERTSCRERWRERMGAEREMDREGVQRGL